MTFFSSQLSRGRKRQELVWFLFAVRSTCGLQGKSLLDSSLLLCCGSVCLCVCCVCGGVCVWYGCVCVFSMCCVVLWSVCCAVLCEMGSVWYGVCEWCVSVCVSVCVVCGICSACVCEGGEERGGGGGGSDSDTNDDVSGDTVADMHLIMGAVSLWTRPPALYLCTAHHEDDELPAKSFSTSATMGARLSPPQRHLWNSHHLHNRDVAHLVEVKLGNLIGQTSSLDRGRATAPRRGCGQPCW